MTESVTTHSTDNVRIIRPLHAHQKLGVGKTTFSDWQNPKSKRYRPDFPKKIQLGANSVGYLESEINAFIQSLANSRTV
ncbi:AlpA family phage regulatory protein [Mannheimia sp. AT1]|uniref:AlpA family phage regulatory protein n=1 Tax=Mannheimia cairinae TaxID=3025936 RepID=A0ABT5MNZ2_9PAST|nr:AlpA family phage regulatory protein [Mannheimia cairinae]MDD0823887.1 AlpA family phage regulatory protein [Mannheimia cairinae]MDD0825203.1 AlpA family phage regulatory protein [Mannheimia cairinae]